MVIVDERGIISKKQSSGLDDVFRVPREIYLVYTKRI